jgi:hypothetical protein
MAWWDLLVDPIMEAMGREKAVAKESFNSILYLALDDGEESTGSTESGLNIYADRLLRRWMELCQEWISGDNPMADLKVNLVKEGLMRYGKKDPKVRLGPRRSLRTPFR